MYIPQLHTQLHLNWCYNGNCNANKPCVGLSDVGGIGQDGSNDIVVASVTVMKVEDFSGWATSEFSEEEMLMDVGTTIIVGSIDADVGNNDTAVA